jgi:hypothetical protein
MLILKTVIFKTCQRIRKCILPFCIIVFIYSSCINRSSPKSEIGKENSNVPPFYIDLEKNLNNIKSIFISNVGKNLEYIFLETNQSSLIGEIDQITLSDSNIYVSDTKKILQFDILGKFIRQIGNNGRGPGEYSYVMDICIDQNNENIFILSYPKLLEFDFKGNFIKTFKIPIMSSQFILQDTNRFLFYQLNLPSKIENRDYSWYIINSQGITLNKIRNTFKRSKSPGMWIDKSPLYSFNKNINLMEFGSDTLLYLKDKIVPEPYAIFNLGKIKMDHDLSLSETNYKEEFNRLKQKLRVSDLNENIQLVFMKLNWGYSDSLKLGIFNKKTLETIFLKDNGFTNDLDGGPPIWPKSIKDDSTIVSWIDAIQLKNHVASEAFRNSIPKYPEKKKELENLANKLKETDNPVIMILR